MDKITEEVLRIYEQMDETRQRMMLAAVDILSNWQTSPEGKFIMAADLSDPKQVSEIKSILKHHHTTEKVTN